MLRHFIITVVSLLAVGSVIAADTESALQVSLRTQRLVSAGKSAYVAVETPETWAARETALIVCDMWDSHHCYRAVLRENQMVPRMNELLTTMRRQGSVIIHAPSGCIDFYTAHPARQRVLQVPEVQTPADINSWCKSIPAEEAVKYPIDQSDGGEDDAPQEHAKWAQELARQGRDPRAPWRRQHAGLTIDRETDYISDQGDEVWRILAHRKIKHVILLGVHTNMCVLGRPFGLRQLAKNGKHVVLMRDLTDSMYNPQSWPHVSHQEGTQLIISHIERHVCPTISSDQILGGKPFAFSPLE